MDVLERKPASLYKDDLKRVIKLLTYKNNKLELKGSASLTSQQFPSDYDLFCVIQHPVESDFVKFLQVTLKKISEADDMWFIELKLQTKDSRPKKIRFFPNQPLKESEIGKVWNKLDFIKLDLIIRIENRFTEVSVIYSFTSTIPTQEEYKKSLEKDISDLRKEKKWYKILKRKFNIAKAEDDKKELLRLSKIFNSKMGEEYQVISNLESIEKILEFYQTDDVFKKVVVNLKDLNIDPEISDLEANLKERAKTLNNTAKTLL